MTLYEGKGSVGRKFLVAGGGGLNLSKEEGWERFVGQYANGEGEESEARWTGILGGVGSEGIREWARGLGVETMVASTGRVYPVGMKAGRLLRGWVERLRGWG